MLLWLWYRLATAAPIQPLAQELPYATGAGLKRKKQRKKKVNQEIEKVGDSGEQVLSE